MCFDWCSIAFGSIEGIFDRSNLIFDQSKIIKRAFFFFFKPLFLTCSSLFKFVSNTVLSLFDRSKGQNKFFSFSFKYFARFLSSYTSKTFLPLLSFIFIIHAFKGDFRTYEILGFFMFLILSFTIDHWVFVIGCYKHDPCALI